MEALMFAKVQPSRCRKWYVPGQSWRALHSCALKADFERSFDQRVDPPFNILWLCSSPPSSCSVLSFSVKVSCFSTAWLQVIQNWHKFDADSENPLNELRNESKTRYIPGSFEAASGGCWTSGHSLWTTAAQQSWTSVSCFSYWHGAGQLEEPGFFAESFWISTVCYASVKLTGK